MSCKVKSRNFCLLSVLWLTMLSAPASFLLSAENKPMNYKLVPNLEMYLNLSDTSDIMMMILLLHEGSPSCS
jgi:hypothetical protein